MKIVDTKPFVKLFSELPPWPWFWRLGGLWEVAIVASYFLLEGKYRDISLYMGFMFLGGVYVASIPKMIKKSFGLILIPVSFSSSDIQHIE
jgi:hypothetical protein